MRRNLLNPVLPVLAVPLLLAAAAALPARADQPPRTTSQFEGEIGRTPYPEVPPPESSPTFLWDFSKAGVVHRYEYHQEVRSSMEMPDMPDARPGAMDQQTSSDGRLLVESQGDGVAQMALKDLTMTTTTGMGEDGPRTVEQKPQPIVVQGLQEDGSYSIGVGTQEMFLSLAFALPRKPLEVGESVDVPATLPFGAMGKLFHVTGRSRMTLTSYVDVSGRTCARFDVDLDVSQLEVPEELQGQYRFSIRGKAVYYFDVERRAFESAESALVVDFAVDAPVSEVTAEGGDESDVGKRARLSTVSDNLIQLRRLPDRAGS